MSGTLLTFLVMVFFVAVTNNGVGNRIMTSTDGITWTSITYSISWNSITYGNGLLLQLQICNSTNCNGLIGWTPRNPIVKSLMVSRNLWKRAFVAVGIVDGFGNRCNDESDGITWTSRTSAADRICKREIRNLWRGLYVAVSSEN
jgi:hypothetical protein